MKQYTTLEQTAKLIELGLPKPSNTIVKEEPIYREGSIIDWKPIAEEGAYSIGELLSFLPKSIKVNDLVFKLCIHSNIVSWIVEYADIAFGTQARLYKEELIDALFAEIVALRKEGVI